MKKSMIWKKLVFVIILLLVGTNIIANNGSTNENIISKYDDYESRQLGISIVEQQLILKPIADFSYIPEEPIIYAHVKFNDESTDTEGKIVSWWWDFDDGYYSELRNPTHCFHKIGKYNVSLTVKNDTGFSDTVKKEVIILEDNIPPYVKIIQPQPRYIEFDFLCLTIRIELPYQKIYGKIYVIVDAWDNVGIESVSFYVDDVLRDIDYEPPYIWLWDDQSPLFPYNLKVIARDYVGNEAVDMIRVWRVQVLP